MKVPSRCLIESHKLVMNLEKVNEHKISAMLHQDFTHNRFFMAVKSLALKIRKCKCVWGGGALLCGICEGFLSNLHSEECAYNFQILLFSDFSHH